MIPCDELLKDLQTQCDELLLIYIRVRSNNSIRYNVKRTYTYMTNIQHIHMLEYVPITICIHYWVLFIVINERHHYCHDYDVFPPSAS